jgi:hypothetical protein
MKNWTDATCDGLISGATASVLSTAALMVCGKIEAGDPIAPTNAISHCIWGDISATKNGFQAKYTIPGYVIHHASSVFWAVILEKYYGHELDKSDASGTLKIAGVATAIACFADYKLTPHRLQPGFEMRLSKPSLFMVYASFAFGLAIGARAVRNKRVDN